VASAQNLALKWRTANFRGAAN